MVSSKLGAILLVLGAMHFFNLYVLNRIRRRGAHRAAVPPVAPDRHIQTLEL
jgi:hypothetical protein